MIEKPAIELCKRYAIESQVASVSQSILQRVRCELACKAVSPQYDSAFVCVEPGEEGRIACTLMTEKELEDSDGPCDKCKEQRIPALKSLQDAKKRMVITRKEIIREGMRWVVAERLQGLK